MNCNTTHYRANSSSVPGDPTGSPVLYERRYYWQTPSLSVSNDRPERGYVVEGRINLGFFPFYKHQDSTLNNNYEVMLADGNPGATLTRLRFFQNTAEIIAGGSQRSADGKVRVPRNPRGPASIYYEVRGTHFDFLEVESPVADAPSLAPVHALVVPRWTPIAGGPGRFTFGVDFGTTNTHVAFAKGAHTDLEVFRIGDERELQTVMLNKPMTSGDHTLAEQYAASFGTLYRVSTLQNREFVPSFIGAHGAEAAFPIRTATCETPNFAGEPLRLFGNINIGFHINRDDTLYLNPEDGHYHTNLKWETDGANREAGQRRIRAFLRELLLLLKHKAALNGGDVAGTQIVWFVPLSMKLADRRLFAQIWQEEYNWAFGEHHATPPLHMLSESLAPYLFLVKQGEIVPTERENVVNVDIGGGTTDALVLRGKTPECTTSFRFAGDVLWGDGSRRARGREKENGFLRYYERQTANSPVAEQARPARRAFEAALKNPDFGSADVVSLLFNFDKQLRFSEQLISAKYLRVVLMLHYTAVVYHVGQVLQARGMQMPRHLSFSGKGSSYIKLLDLNHNLSAVTELARLVLGFSSGQEVPINFRLTVARDPKEATANGGVRWIADGGTEGLNPEMRIPSVALPGDGAVPPEGAAPVSTTLGKAKEMREDVLTNARRLLRYLTHDEPKVRGLLEDLNVEFDPDFLYNFLSSEMQDSLNAGLNLLSDTSLKKDEDELAETLFFFPFKDSLHKLSQELYQRHYAGQPV